MICHIFFFYLANKSINCQYIICNNGINKNDIQEKDFK